MRSPSAVRLAEHPGGVPHGRPRLDGGEGDHLCHPVAAVLLGGVAHHVGSVALVEVHVDVGHLLAPRVQEALEQEVVADGIEVHDPQAVGHAATRRRASARTHPDPRLTSEADEVPHDEEVGGESHVADDAELVVQPLDDLGWEGRPVALPGPFSREVPEVGERPVLVGVTGEALRHRELGQARAAQLNLDVRPLRDEQRVVARFGHLSEKVPHLGRALQVVLGALELEAVGVAQQRSGLDAEQRVVSDRILAVGVVAVVGREQRGPDAAGDLNQLGVRPVLVRDAVVLQLDEEVVPAEDVLQTGRPALGLRLVSRQQRLEHHPSETSGGGDDALVVPFEKLPVDPGLVVVALDVGRRGELHQVAVPVHGLGQEGEVVVELLTPLGVSARVVDPPPPRRALVARLARHVGLGADDRHDALVAAGLVEIEDPVHVAVVRDAEGALAVGHGGRHQVTDPRRAVEHGELGMGVQMRKRPLRHRPPFSTLELTPVSFARAQKSNPSADALGRTTTPRALEPPRIAGRTSGERPRCRVPPPIRFAPPPAR